ncbi:hypothetical protein DPMN_141492 [Dreissena polymorpha]|uniref:EGF-like domain-containing protein n=1 Tax=Dreissena polymorpha TaxID=45954 RepID=A0A9D4GCU4_DREPO|nr:hypothetical protein DPMN_141492 [Dreissena polymorpha]
MHELQRLHVLMSLTDVNECLTGLSRCENGGTCVNEIGGYKCLCPPGFTGPFCSAGKRRSMYTP